MGLIARRYSGGAWAILLGGTGLAVAAGSAAASCALPGYSIGDVEGTEGTAVSAVAAGTGGEMSSSVGTGGAGGEGTGTGGAENTIPCTTKEECVKAQGPCRTSECVDMKCEFTNRDAPDANSPGGFVPVGCVNAKCHEGQLLFEPDPSKVHMDGNDCTVDACDGSYVDHSPLIQGKVCSTSMSGGVCNGAAQCVECVTLENCEPGSKCVAGRCIEALCDVKCGGTCEPCGLNGPCSRGSDCFSGSCKQGACVAASCSDGARNEGETDVDCGGMACTTCVIGRRCGVDGDCTSGLCMYGVCQFTCADKVKNGHEQDVDCGGPSCPSCPAGAP